MQTIYNCFFKFFLLGRGVKRPNEDDERSSFSDSNQVRKRIGRPPSSFATISSTISPSSDTSTTNNAVGSENLDAGAEPVKSSTDDDKEKDGVSTVTVSKINLIWEMF